MQRRDRAHPSLPAAAHPVEPLSFVEAQTYYPRALAKIAALLDVDVASLPWQQPQRASSGKMHSSEEMHRMVAGIQTGVSTNAASKTSEASAASAHTREIFLTLQDDVLGGLQLLLCQDTKSRTVDVVFFAANREIQQKIEQTSSVLITRLEKKGMRVRSCRVDIVADLLESSD